TLGFQLRFRVSQIKYEIGFNAAGVINLTKRAEIFFSGLEIFLVVIFNPEPFQNLRWHFHPAIAGLSHEVVYLLGERSPIFQIELTENNSERREIVVLLLV